MKPRDNRSIHIKGIKCAQQQFIGKHESLTCYLHMQGMLNNNTTSYTVYARAVTINYPYMTIFTFHNLGGERFILFTNQIISLCTSKHFFLSVYLLFFFFGCLCQPCLLLRNSVISFFSLICYISLPLLSFCSSHNKNQATRGEELFHFACKTISSPCLMVICSPLLHALHTTSTPWVKI